MLFTLNKTRSLHYGLDHFYMRMHKNSKNKMNNIFQERFTFLKVKNNLPSFLFFSMIMILTEKSFRHYILIF